MTDEVPVWFASYVFATLDAWARGIEVCGWSTEPGKTRPCHRDARHEGDHDRM